MTINLSHETNRMIEERMKKWGYADPDAVVRFALETLEEMEGEAIEELDEETQAALARAVAQSDRGEGRPWEEVRAELRARLKR